MTILKKLLFSMESMIGLILIAAVAMGVATFVEHDFGSDAARALVYSSRWFEVLLLLLMINLISNIFRYRLLKRGKWFTFLFHLSFIVILLGATVTRYGGYEAFLHFREGDTSNTLLSDRTYLKVTVEDGGQIVVRHRPLLLSPLTRNRFEESISVNDETIMIRYAGFIPRAEKAIREDPAGDSVVTLSAADATGSYHLVLKAGESIRFGDRIIAFQAKLPPDEKGVTMAYVEGRLTLMSTDPVSVTPMGQRGTRDIEAQEETALESMMVYRMGTIQLVLRKFYSAARVQAVKPAPEDERQGRNADRADALIVDVSTGGTLQRITLFGGSGLEGNPEKIISGSHTITLAFGSREIPLPFALKLTDFQIERYPGSTKPSSFASEMVILDQEKGVERPCRIYMNHILRYRGYRFFQASYDEDEKGSVLTASYDPGTPLIYLGFLILSLGLMGHLFHAGSRFRQLGKKIAASSAKSLSLWIIIGAGVFSSSILSAQPKQPEAVSWARSLDREHCRKFGSLLVQEEGRIQPVNTSVHEFLDGIDGISFPGLHPDQLALGLFLHPDFWRQVPMIPVGDPMLLNVLGLFIKEERAAYLDFFDPESGGYKLAGPLRQALQKSSRQRGRLDREIIKVDDMLHLLDEMLGGSRFRLFPKEEDPSLRWFSCQEVLEQFPESGKEFVAALCADYRKAVQIGLTTNAWEEADTALLAIQSFQKKFGADIIPDKNRIRMELLYNRLKNFQWLGLLFMTGGLLLLMAFFLMRLKPSWHFPLFEKGLFFILLLGFVFLTAGLILRWIAAGHAPWTNKYESMIFIAWATLLAGAVFSRRDTAPLALAGLWSGLILWISHMEWMDTSITTLVPVLRSHWLIVHVSIIVTSYGFFGLGAVLGLFILLLFIIRTKQNEKPLESAIQKLTWINERVLTVGLILVTIGNLFGAVWANESWGRYWGWDPKETWTLVMIIVYAVVLHFRLIPGLKRLYVFNAGAVLAFSTVLMTYLGVNMYLSGRHSYAGGEAVPMLLVMAVSVVLVLAVLCLAFFKRKLSIENN